MRVVYVHPFAQQLSGPDESLLALLAPLLPLGVDTHLVVPRIGPSAERYRALGVTVHESVEPRATEFCPIFQKLNSRFSRCRLATSSTAQFAVSE